MVVGTQGLSGRHPQLTEVFKDGEHRIAQKVYLRTQSTSAWNSEDKATEHRHHAIYTGKRLEYHTLGKVHNVKISILCR